MAKPFHLFEISWEVANKVGYESCDVILGVASLPDLKKIARHNVATGAPQRGIARDGLAWSRDGKRLAIIGRRGEIGTHDVKTGQWRSVGALPAHVHALSVDFSPDGRRLAVGLADGGVAVWDLPVE